MRFGASQIARAGSICSLAWVLSGTSSAALAQSAPTTGVLHVSARVESGCRVAGQSEVSGVDFGELDFSAHPSLFRQPLTAQALLSTSTLQLRCVGVTSAFVTVDAGMHADGNQRRLSTGTHYVPYDLFLDEAGARPLSLDMPTSVAISDSGAQAVVELPVYGRVLPSIGGYSPGSYQDFVQITVSW